MPVHDWFNYKNHMSDISVVLIFSNSILCILLEKYNYPKKIQVAIFS
jgi:hypothetical protein